MEYRKKTVAIKPSRQGVFPRKFSKLPHKSRLLEQKGKNILPVELGQYWLFQYWPSSTRSIFSSIDPVADSGVAALKIRHRVVTRVGIYCEI